MWRTKEDTQQQLILETDAFSFDSGSELDEDTTAAGDNSNTYKRKQG
jgi:hypothetical protein